MEAAKTRLSERVPFATLILVFAAGTGTLVPSLGDFLIYNRQAILEGAVWRLLTAPLVHFSVSHLFWDALLVICSGWLIHYFRFQGFILLYLLTAVLPGCWLLTAQPNVHYYGGLSGLATAGIVFLSLKFAVLYPKQKFIWVIILALVFAKITVETVSGGAIFAQITDKSIQVLPSIHIIGVFSAVLVSALTRSRSTERKA